MANSVITKYLVMYYDINGNIIMGRIEADNAYNAAEKLHNSKTLEVDGIKFTEPLEPGYGVCKMEDFVNKLLFSYNVENYFEWIILK